MKNNANIIAKGIQIKQKHHHQEILIIPAAFNIHNIIVISKGNPSTFIDILFLRMFIDI